MHQCLISAAHWIIACFLFTLAAVGANPNQLTDEIPINCGSIGTSIAPDSRRWLGDIYPSFTIKGSSTGSTVTGELIIDADPVPYKTVRISDSQFSYIFQVNSGQKLIRLHFYPASYNGFKRSDDFFFNVEAGPFTLLSNFSASITANALAVNFLTKEFCIIIEENYPLNITFSTATVCGEAQDTHAFIMGIDVISVPSVPETRSYCHTGDVGVQVVGEKFLVYIDNNTALEMVHRQNTKRDSVSSGDDFLGIFGLWAAVFSRKGSVINNTTWRIHVDVGFRYLVRLLFCEVGLNLADNYNTSFSILINKMAVFSNADILREREDKHAMICRNYMVMEKGRKLEGKRSIIISLQSEEDFIQGQGPLKGFEIFKLSNHDNSLSSPNPLPPEQDLPFWIMKDWRSVLGSKSIAATVAIIVICLVNIIFHMLRQTWEAKTKPSTRITQTCHCFSLPEIHKATKNFNDIFVIGRGGFGKVYKGFINDGQEIVAIKRLKPNSKQGKREFWTEVETLSEVRHVNLVSLIGYCNEQQELILVYDYMPNGLSDHLYRLGRNNSNYSYLSWEERLKICIGAGRGLDYLHTGKGIMHRDVKSSNILLDETFVAKVSDFGLAKTERLSQESTNLKGTFGYIDPDYFKTSKLTMKSDTYAFGVVLLEVLCGRPAVDPLAREGERSLTMWARDNISKGEVDRIIAPSLSGGISPDSLKVFLGIVESCLHDEPNKRPVIAHVVINLEFALEKQKENSLVQNDISSFLHISPFTDKPLASSRLQNMSSLMTEQTNCRLVNGEPLHGKGDGQKSIIDKISRLLPWDSLRKSAKPLKRVDHAGIPVSAPISNHTSNNKLSSRFSSTYPPKKLSIDGGNNDLISNPNFRIFSFSELKFATRNFREDAIVAEGGFGRVYKGFLKEKSAKNNGSGSIVAIKRLSPEGMQGFREWMSEINFLGKLSHPNLIKLLGYCYEDTELLLVYEFVKKGNLGNHLFRTRSAIETLPWNIRLKILTGAARGLSYLHNLEVPVIYKDFKTPNIFLDGSYNAKLSDVGLAKSGPSASHTHVSTAVMGTLNYAAPEYMATGHLTVKSDIYGFGVVLLEMLTGLRALDRRRHPGQQSLVDFIKTCVSNRKNLVDFMDSRLEGRYPVNSAFQVYLLAKKCVEDNHKARPSMKEVVEILDYLEKIGEPTVRFNH